MVKEIPALFRFPMLNLIDESAKRLLLSDIELIAWLETIIIFFKSHESVAEQPTQKEVKQQIYHCGLEVKRQFHPKVSEYIETYLKYYHNIDFSGSSSVSEFAQKAHVFTPYN